MRLAWTLSPAIAWGISQPVRPETTSLTPVQELFLRGIARRTWRFFETFVTAEDNYLPPDNYQERPVVAVAHRTSPTDIGLSLLANLTAYDFGYIPARELIERTHRTVTSIGLLKRFRGHLYNWYDTITLEPQLPRYISTVDSGNLAGDILVLRQGLYELPSYPVLSKGFAVGLSDTLSLLSDAIDAATNGKKGVVPAGVLSRIADLKDSAARLPGPTCETSKHLSGLDRIASEVLADLSDHQDEEVRWWAAATKRQIETHVQDFKTFTAWESTGNPPDSIRDEVPQELVPYLSLFCTKVETLNNQVPSLEDVAGIRHDLDTRLNPLLEWLDSPMDTNSISGPGHQWLIRTLAGMRNSGERAEALISSLVSSCRPVQCIY